MKKIFPSLLGTLALIGGLGVGLVLIQESQDIRKKAAEPADTTTSKIVELATKLGEGANSSIAVYKSDLLGYQIRINKDLWQESLGTDLTRNDLSEVSFSLRSNYGNANVKMRAYSEDEFYKAIAGRSISSEETLVSVANYYQRNPDIPQGAKIAEAKAVQKGGKEVYRFTVTQRILGVDTQFYQDLSFSDNKYYVITANYPASLPEVSALTESFVDDFNFYSTDTTVKGSSTSKDSGSQILDEVKVAELAKPSVVNIVTLFCNDLTVPDSGSLKYLKPSYKYCDGAMGSGFFISENGHIGTNGHVVKIYPEMSFVSGIQSGSLKFFLIDLVKEMTFQRDGIEISNEQALGALSQTMSNPQSFQALLVGMYDFLDKKVLIIKEGQTRYFVKLSNEPITFDENKIKSGDILNAIVASSQIKEAELVGFDYPNSLSVDAVLRQNVPQGSDVAIIKMKDTGVAFPALKLGSIASLKDGSQLLVIGYPGLVSGSQTDKTSIISHESSAQPTITRGVVSSIKTDNSGRRLVQTDTSIDHGNSGGPAFNNNGEVVGIATYGFGSQSGNYNFLRDIEDLKKLANDNAIALTESQSYINWESGLFYFWDRYYRKSVKLFDVIKEDYPIHPSIDTYIADAQIAIENGEDRSGIIGALTDKFSPTVLIVVFGLFIVIGVGGVIFVIKKKKNQKTETGAVSNPPLPPSMPSVQPTTPTPPVTTSQPQQDVVTPPTTGL